MKDLRDAAVFVSTYGKYTNGILDGDWFLIANYPTKKDFVNAIRKRHADERQPEFMYQDWENIPDGYITESEISDDLFLIVQEIANLDEIEAEAFFDYIDLKGSNLRGLDIDEILEIFREDYMGDFFNERDFAEYFVEEFGYPEDMELYFDADSYATDIFITDFDFYKGHVFGGRKR